MYYSVGLGLELETDGKGESAITIGFIELIKKMVDGVVKVERNALSFSQREQHTCTKIWRRVSEGEVWKCQTSVEAWLYGQPFPLIAYAHFQYKFTPKGLFHYVVIQNCLSIQVRG